MAIGEKCLRMSLQILLFKLNGAPLMSVTEFKPPHAMPRQSPQKPVTQAVSQAVKASGHKSPSPPSQASQPTPSPSEGPSDLSHKTDPGAPTEGPLNRGASASSPASAASPASSDVEGTPTDVPGSRPSSSVQTEEELAPQITVVGVGGAGCNAVNNMISSHLQGVQFVVCNTDAQALSHSLTDRRIQLGQQITQGLGAGSKPEVGRAAAEESLQEIITEVSGSNMVFITAGMGGGTGTGAAPVVAQAAREMGILTVAVATKPFHFEGNHRMKTADQGIEELAQYVDTLIIIPNQNLFRIATEKTGFMEAFKMADNVLHSGVRGVTDLMMMPGLINLDFADIRSVMSEMGKAMMGTGEASGDGRSIAAAEAAISNPLLDDVSMKGARGVLINITGGMDMTLFEVDEAANRIRDEVDPNANIIFGSTFDEKLKGVMRVSVVATGIDAEESRRRFVQYQEEKAFQERSLSEMGQGGSEPLSETTEDHRSGLQSAPEDQAEEGASQESAAFLRPLDSDSEGVSSSIEEAFLTEEEALKFETYFPPLPEELSKISGAKKKGFFSRFAATLRRGRSSEEENELDTPQGKSASHQEDRMKGRNLKSSSFKSDQSEQTVAKSEEAGASSAGTLEDESVQDVPAYLRRRPRR